MNKTLVMAKWLLVTVMVLSGVSVIMNAIEIRQQKHINNFIADPGAFETVPDHGYAQFAKAAQLEANKQHDLALEQLTLVLGSDETTLTPLAYFNRGNISLREALSMTASDGRQIPLIELAKQDYRSALAIQPALWDARHNLELALRVVPEDPDSEEDFEKKIIHSERSIESKAFKVDLP